MSKRRLSVPELGIRPPRLLVPNPDKVDFEKWAVVACDQFTAKTDYWEDVEKIVGDSPSALRLIYPEAYLNEAPEKKKERIEKIHVNMKKYVDEGILKAVDGFVYVERSVEGKTRRGIVGEMDLEAYNYKKGAKSLIRATEGTIEDRLPPRKAIRKGALMELPHILVLIDDRQGEVIEPLAKAKDKMKPLYDIELMKKSGHVSGWLVDKESEGNIMAGIQSLSDPAKFAKKYDVPEDEPLLLFAMGDGNHSLATAKAIWEEEKIEKKKTLNDNDYQAFVATSPLRYALVEIENVHDEGIIFEAIHRTLFHVNPKVALWELLLAQLSGLSRKPVKTREELDKFVREPKSGVHRFGYIHKDEMFICEAPPKHNLAVGTVQGIVSGKPGAKIEQIDYVHGLDETVDLGLEDNNASFLLPPMAKNDLFKTVLDRGALPRKTFSMGEAEEKRFYIEARYLK